MKAVLFSGILYIATSGFLCALSIDSLPDGKQKQAKAVVKNFTAPVILIGLGLYTKIDGHLMNRFAVRNWRNDNFPNFSNHVDNVIPFVPIAFVYTLDLLEVKPKNDLINRTLLLVKSEVIMNGTVFLLKHTTNIMRPDGSSNNSFPSGHTAQAFVAATFIHKELGHKSVWYRIGAYTMASTVGAFRILNNRHWISDVLAGAGIGILSTNIAYATHQYKWGKKPGLVVLPTYTNGLGVYVSWKMGAH